MADEWKRLKRLSDGEFEVRYNRELAGPHGVNASLQDDHIQTRRDVKTLAAEVRKLSDYEQEHTGSMCWCNDGRETPCYVGTPSDMCLRLNLLLREVDPR